MSSHPLSPLSSSRQNSRVILSPRSPPVSSPSSSRNGLKSRSNTESNGLDEIMGIENFDHHGRRDSAARGSPLKMMSTSTSLTSHRLSNDGVDDGYDRDDGDGDAIYATARKDRYDVMADRDQDQDQDHDHDGLDHVGHNHGNVQNVNVEDDETESYQNCPSSPFQFEARDETVDVRESGGEGGLCVPKNAYGAGRGAVGTSRKRSYDSIPEDDEEEAGYEMDERYKRPSPSGSGRREGSSTGTSVYVDGDSGSGNDFYRRDDGIVASSFVEEQLHENMSTVVHGEDQSDKEIGDADFGDEGTDTRRRPVDAVADADTLHDPMDDTCLSTFSAVPNVDMTLFAKLRPNSPTKSAVRAGTQSPSQVRESPHRVPEQSATPRAARTGGRSSVLLDNTSVAGSPITRRRESRDGNGHDDTLNLLDLTSELNFHAASRRHSRLNNRYSPRRSPMRLMHENNGRSPSKLSLLDFDIPAIPTPRSLPTITPRELETLKSGFLSEISSLRATLSGKEAEVASLKQAVADAERRVGEALEEVRNEAGRKEALEIEQAEWQRRGQEMESVLRSIRAEIVSSEQEQDRLAKRADEAERGKEQLEGKVVELENQLEAARKTAAASGTGRDGDGCRGDCFAAKSAEESAAEVQEAVEKVARELHTLYKSKHETKVAALKKSYEARWEKRVREAENRWKAAVVENERLQSERDIAVSTSNSNAANLESSMMNHVNEEYETERRILEAQIKGLQSEMAALKDDSERLRSELKMERAEKGELVAAVDEWLAIQHGQHQQHQHDQHGRSESPLVVDDGRSGASEAIEPEQFNRSISRSGGGGGGVSGIRPPRTGSNSSGGGDRGERNLGRYAAAAPPAPGGGVGGGGHSRANSGGGKSGIAIPMFTPARNGGILGSIERMGRGGA